MSEIKGNNTRPSASIVLGRTAWVIIGVLGCVLLIAAVGSNSAAARQEDPHAGAKDAAALDWKEDCARCHYCDVPTPENNCLRLCTRNRRDADADKEMGPDVVVIDQLEKDYLPVPFDHRGHAEMAQMGDGCESCHHHTPEGKQHPPCATCHSPTASGTSIHKPGLRGALHQQCLGCHREWIDERDCHVCHRPKTRADGKAKPQPKPTKDDILGRMHPPIPEPKTELYQGSLTDKSASRVVFRHEKHKDTFGLKCVDCHRESSCARCHVREDSRQDKPQTRAEHHRPCIGCHKKDMSLAAREQGRCSRCHWKKGEPKPEPFDHADTGWELKPYHQKLSCRACHVQVPFRERKTDCSACHDEWDPDMFDHSVTGQALDEMHELMECEDCHQDSDYSKPPTCEACHDPEDGIVFPAKRPGPFVGFDGVK